MSLNIKNQRVHELARQAAQRFGMSQTSAIEEALVRLLASHDQESSAKAEAEIYEILAVVDARLNAEQREALVAASDSLYDEKGLPA